MSSSTAAHARQLLTPALGNASDFRPGQLEAIEALVDRRSLLLVVQATGWGKSVVYFIATKLLRQAGSGPTILISRLLSLMRDQIRMAERLGVRALTLNSANKDDWPRIKEDIAEDRCDILLVSPERLRNAEFETGVLPSIRGGIGLLVVDEAHCVSDWGHDFRPDYRRIIRVVRRLHIQRPGARDHSDRQRPRDRGRRRPVRQPRGAARPLAQRSLRLQSINLVDQAERLAWLDRHVPSCLGRGSSTASPSEIARESWGETAVAFSKARRWLRPWPRCAWSRSPRPAARRFNTSENISEDVPCGAKHRLRVA